MIGPVSYRRVALQGYLLRTKQLDFARSVEIGARLFDFNALDYNLSISSSSTITVPYGVNWLWKFGVHCNEGCNYLRLQASLHQSLRQFGSLRGGEFYRWHDICYAETSRCWACVVGYF